MRGGTVVRDRVLVSEEALVLGAPADDQLTEQLLAHLWTPSPPIRFLTWLTGLGTAIFALAILYTFLTGLGTWGNDIPNAWAFAIINFVFWIGIGHAGTFISAILLVMEQPWRNAVNRFAETMTLFAVTIAALFPLLHLGRPWFFYWLLPYPATMDVWPQFRSALTGDVAAILTYFTVSLLFWYMGLVPDLATARDRAPERWRKRVYGVFALGWRGSAKHWWTQRMAYGIIGALATPLVISVHTIVSMDFATGNTPGWHSTIFPPYFVIGAIHSGFAMALVLLVPIRKAFGFENVVTDRHLASTATILLVCACLIGYCYLDEQFIAWYTGDTFERQTYLVWRTTGPYGWLYWLTIFTNTLIPQLLWFPSLRRSPVALFFIGLSVLVGMWTERFALVVGPLSQDFLPASWGLYVPSIVDWTILGGSFSCFFFLYLLALRFLPLVPISEVKETKEEHGVPEIHPAMPARPIGDEVEGIVAEYPRQDPLILAIEGLRGLGLEKFDAHMPWRSEEVLEALQYPRVPVTRWALIAGLGGAFFVYYLQWWINVVDYPLDVGGRPLHSALAFVPITFELGVLCATFGAFFGWLWYCGLPRPWHPLFEVPGFDHVTTDRFFLTIDGRDPQFDAARVVSLLHATGAISMRPLPEPLTDEALEEEAG